MIFDNDWPIFEGMNKNRSWWNDEMDMFVALRPKSSCLPSGFIKLGKLPVKIGWFSQLYTSMFIADVPWDVPSFAWIFPWISPWKNHHFPHGCSMDFPMRPSPWASWCIEGQGGIWMGNQAGRFFGADKLYPLVNQHSYWKWPFIVDLSS